MLEREFKEERHKVQDVKGGTRTEDGVAGYCDVARRSSERYEPLKQTNKNVWGMDRQGQRGYTRAR